MAGTYRGTERRAQRRPCPSDPGACWWQGGTCAACVSAHLQEMGELLEQELVAGCAEPARLLARRITLLYARRYAGEAPYVASDRESRRARRDMSIRAAVGDGMTVQTLQARYALSRSQLYRILQCTDEE